MVFSDAEKMNRPALRERASWSELAQAYDALNEEAEHFSKVSGLVLAEMRKRNPDFKPI